MNIIKGFPATSQNSYQLNVTNILKHGSRNFGKQEIVSKKHDDTLFRYTYKDAYKRAQRLANSLLSLGIEVGDRVGVLAWNTNENYEIYFGLPGTGAVMLTMNLRLNPKELLYITNHAQARFVFVHDSLLPLAEAIAPKCESLEGFVVITDKNLCDVETRLDPIYSYNELLRKAKSYYEWPNIDETSAYSACYTTGTTGKPKGVYSSHRDVYLQAMMYAANACFSINDSIFQIVPMFHVLGWGTPQAATLIGSKLVFPGRYSLNNVEEILQIMVKEKVTVFNAATSFIMPMLEYIKAMDSKPDLSGVRFLCGASEPPITMMKEYKEITGAEIIHTYGSTEAMAIVTINNSKPWLEEKLPLKEKWQLKRKQGYVVSGLDVKIIDSNGKELPIDGKSVGEILLRGPWVTKQYYRSPNSEEQFSEDGYWKSGDAGTLDEEGYLKITDRLKDLIKSGGEWISSIDMENFIVSHPAVVEAAVIGAVHPKWEERPIALVVLRNENEKTVKSEDIHEYLTKDFAKWQLPEKILFVKSIPKTSVGKIDKKVIKDQYRDIFIKELKS
ncbi:MAG: long-chain-fatty-acid--CoA ligase [Candidatus Hodarchaeota archaeon]